MSLSGYIFCKMCEKSDRKRDEGLEIPKDVEYVRDIRYGAHKKYHTLDICWPKRVEGQEVDVKKDKLPVIVSVHGGGYVYGSKEVYQFYAACLAQKGFVVINHNYRLAPKYKFPAPLEDLSLVLCWMAKQTGNYPVDPENVFLVGDSAGAQIASQYGVIHTNPAYETMMGIARPQIGLRGLGLCCGLYDIRKKLKAEGCKGSMRDYLTGNPSRFGEKLHILEHITKDYPPTYLFSAQGDFLLTECKPMAELLASKGILCEYKIYGNEQTGHVFHVDMRNEFSAQANAEQTEFFKALVR